MIDKAPSETYAGRVIDEYGKAVVGATVYALQLSQANGEAHMSFGADSIVVVTDEQGQFSFSKEAASSSLRPACDDSFDFEHAACVVLADTGDRCGLAAFTPDVEGVIVLQPPVSLRMRVVDSAGTPIADVRVSLESLTVGACYCSISRGGPERWRPESDVNGHVELRGLPGPCEVEVEVASGRWASSQAQLYASNCAPAILPEIRLVKGASVSGRVLLPDGSPAANFVVGFHINDYHGRSLVEITDIDGRYHVRHLAPGESYLSFLHDPDWRQRWIPDRHITFTARDSEEIVLGDVRLIGPTMIQGRVVEEGSGAGVAGIDVTLFSMRDRYNGDGLAKGITDAAGRFQLEALIRDPLVARLLLKATRGMWEGYQTPVPPFEEPIEIVLRPLDTGSVFGTVVSRSGVPITGARVELHEWGRLEGPVAATTTTDENGDYRFDDVPSALYSVQASATGFATGYSPGHKVLMTDTTQRKDVKLKPLDRPVSGLVLDWNSNPVCGAAVSVDGIQARTDADGRFLVTAAKGRLNIVVYGPAQTFAQVELPAGRKSITITLEQQQNR